ncbi:MAG: hypothetical protein WAM97_10580 [Acidimicrobiales bacterium]
MAATKRQHKSTDIVAIPQWLTALEMVEDDVEVADQISERILQADSLEAALGASASDLEKARSFVGRPIEIRGATLRRTNLGLGAYAVIDFIDLQTNRHGVMACGAQNVLTMLVKAKVSDWYPFTAELYEAPSKSNPGQSVLWLGPTDYTDEPI